MGKVFLVGAGPGNVEYLTVRAQQLLSEAEVLIYDALVDDRLLALVPPNCIQFDVGKRGGSPSTPQAEINKLLVEQCRQGNQVVRLKSGDPFIFGRATSEILALQEAGCPFEVVPGLSSALAAPLLAGIPLTDSVLSRSFAVVSAHEPDELDWEALARLETLVILMGGRHLDEIVQHLQRHGRSLSSPIAVIRDGGRPEQEVWVGTLNNIVEQTANYSLSPTVIVIGEVVGLRNYLRSPEELKIDSSQELEVGKLNAEGDPGLKVGKLLAQRGEAQVEGSSELNVERLEDNLQPATNSHLQPSSQPLTGKTVLVTRSAGQSSEFSNLLQQQGARVIEMPALVITEPSSWEDLDHAIAYLSDFDWIILTSSNGVDYFFERLFAQGKNPSVLANTKIAVVGKKTAASLKAQGLVPDFIPPDFVADSLVEHFPEPLQDTKVLFPRVESGGRDVLMKQMTEQGAKVTEVAAYQSGCPTQIVPEALEALQQQTVDVISFASSKTVKHFVQLLETFLPGDSEQFPTAQSRLENVCIASIGPQTSLTCRQLIGRVDVEAKEYTLDGLTQAILQLATLKNS